MDTAGLNGDKYIQHYAAYRSIAKNGTFRGIFAYLSIHLFISNDMYDAKKNNGRPHKLHKICWALYNGWILATLSHKNLHRKSITHILPLAFHYFSLRSMVSSVVLLHSTPAVSITYSIRSSKLCSVCRSSANSRIFMLGRQLDEPFFRNN